MPASAGGLFLHPAQMPASSLNKGQCLRWLASAQALAGSGQSLLTLAFQLKQQRQISPAAAA